MIKQAYYSFVRKDDLPYPKSQYTIANKTSNLTMLSVYGVCSNPTKGSHILVFNSQGQESVQFGIPNDFVNRLKDLKEGEVALVNTKNSKWLIIKENGDLETNSNFIVNGDLTVTGNTTIKGDAIIGPDAISFLNHFHLGNLGYNTGIPETGAGVSPPNTPPKMSSDNIDMQTNDVINIGAGSITAGTHGHEQGNDGGSDSEVKTDGPS
jgi:hypothetical protein